MSFIRCLDARIALGVSLKAGVAAAALTVPSLVFAQDADEDGSEQSAEQPDQVTTAPQTDGGAIVVTGIRSSLEDALNIRRKADVFLDGISSDDIGSTPDLNLGEALARIPGVQINREGARRDATISVRGLPGRFTQTTVQGQRIASTTRGTNTGNPFGIFETSIFNGANVIKSFTADTPAGGLAAQVDLRINSALERREGFVVRAEIDHEETTGDEVGKFFISGAQRFGERLGVYGTVAYSEQSFRRDTLRVNEYRQFTANQRAAFANGTAASGLGDEIIPGPNAAFDIDLVGANGLNNVIIAPRQIRQFVQNNRGDRLSLGGGFAYQLSDNLAFRVDGIYTKRDLGESNQDIAIFETHALGSGNNSFDRTNSVITPLSSPLDVGVVDFDDDGTQENVFLVPRIQVSDAQTAIGNRRFPASDESWAIYPQFNFENEDWRVDVVGTYSEATGRGALDQYDLRVRSRGGSNTTRAQDSNLDGIDDRGNNSILLIDQGSGSLDDFLLRNTIDPRLLELDSATNFSSEFNTFGGGARFLNFAPPGPNGGNPFQQPTSLFVLGFNEGVKRDLQAIDVDIARKFEGSFITEVQVGGYYSNENSDRFRDDYSGLGLNYPAAFDNSILRLNDAVNQGAAFLGGDIPGAEIENFLSLNIPVLESLVGSASREPRDDVSNVFRDRDLRGFFPQLTTASAESITAEELLLALPLVSSPSGNVYLTMPQFGRDQVLDTNFSSSRETVELYGMAKFDLGEVSGTQLRGNIGMRYVRTDLEGATSPTIFQFYDNLNAIRAANGGEPLEFRRAGDPNAFSPGAGSNSFERFLPSINLIYEITPDIVMRAAYYTTFEAIDLAEFNPTPTLIAENAFDPDEDNPDDFDPDSRIVGSDGNPIPNTNVSISTLDVRPRRSNAFDLGISWYNRPGSVVSVGFFRKSLIGDISRQRDFCPEGQDFVVNGTTFNDVRRADPNSADPIEAAFGGSCVFTNDLGDAQRIRIDRTANNPDTINVTGFEAQIQQNFDFLPGLLANTGMVLNYTRVRSGGDNDVQLFNVAEDTYNIIGYYEDDLIQARLAYNHQSSIQRQGGSSFVGGNTVIAPRGQLDFSGAIRPMRGLEIRGEVFNITQSSRREYLGTEELFRLYEYDGRTYSLSATYRF